MALLPPPPKAGIIAGTILPSTRQSPSGSLGTRYTTPDHYCVSFSSL